MQAEMKYRARKHHLSRHLIVECRIGIALCNIKSSGTVFRLTVARAFGVDAADNIARTRTLRHRAPRNIYGIFRELRARLVGKYRETGLAGGGVANRRHARARQRTALIERYCQKRERRLRMDEEQFRLCLVDISLQSAVYSMKPNYVACTINLGLNGIISFTTVFCTSGCIIQ